MCMSFVNPATVEARVAICEALGIDPAVTKDVKISMCVGDVAVLQVWQYLSVEQAEKLGQTLVRLDLVTKEHAQRSA